MASGVILVPCVRHALGKTMAPYRHRLEMCRLLVREAGDDVEVSDIEERLGLSGFTIDTLEALSKEFYGQSLRLVVGADIMHERDRWHRFDDVRALAPLIVVARRGHDDVHVDLPAVSDVSSTRIRACIATGERPVGLVPEAVLTHIERHRLYTR